MQPRSGHGVVAGPVVDQGWGAADLLAAHLMRGLYEGVYVSDPLRLQDRSRISGCGYDLAVVRQVVEYALAHHAAQVDSDAL